MTSVLPFNSGLNLSRYCRFTESRSLFSRLNCRLLAEAESRVSTGLPASRDTLSLSLLCCSATPDQTSDWLNPSRAANFSWRELRDLVLEEKAVGLSAPRLVQRPCSTQKLAKGTWPDCGGRIRSSLTVRSWRPPLTMSPALRNTVKSLDRFSMVSSCTLPVSL